MALYITIRKNLLNSAIILILVPCCNTHKKKNKAKNKQKNTNQTANPQTRIRKSGKMMGRKIFCHIFIFSIRKTITSQREQGTSLKV